LNKIDNSLNNKPKRLNKMFTSILAPLFLMNSLSQTNLIKKFTNFSLQN